MKSLKGITRLEKHKWIVELVKNKTFVDVGGLWNTVNETVTIASKAGAKSSTMSDIQAAGNVWWQKFDERCAEYGVTDYDCNYLDICDTASLTDAKKYDFVHCSGIMYHVSDPIQFIQNLMTITNDYLLISSLTIPAEIENSKGKLFSPEGSAHLVHMLPDQTRGVLGEYLKSKGMKENIVERKLPDQLFQKNGTVKTGPWWWVYSPETLNAMCEMCGLKILKQDTNKIYSHSVLCEMP